MAAKSKSRGPLPQKPKASNDAEEKIRLRAYQLYEEGGRIDCVSHFQSTLRDTRHCAAISGGTGL
jgi:hypothetical protein